MIYITYLNVNFPFCEFPVFSLLHLECTHCLAISNIMFNLKYIRRVIVDQGGGGGGGGGAVGDKAGTKARTESSDIFSYQKMIAQFGLFPPWRGYIVADSICFDPFLSFLEYFKNGVVWTSDSFEKTFGKCWRRPQSTQVKALVKVYIFTRRICDRYLVYVGLT